MSGIKITIDRSKVERLGDDFLQAAEIGLRRVLERGEQILREEVPKATHNLSQGISSEFEKKGRLLQGNLIISARTGRRNSRTATLHLPSGKTKQISLRGQSKFDYAEAVATGTGIYGPNNSVIVPKQGQALLIPVQTVPTGEDGKPEAYIERDGQLFIIRRSMKGTKPNPYDERTAKRLGDEAQAIFDKALDDFEKQQQP